MPTPEQSPYPRDRPACARCGGTGMVRGMRLYPGTGAARSKDEPCPVCGPVSPTGVARSERQQRQLSERERCTVLLFEALFDYADTTDLDYDEDAGRGTYIIDGHTYTVALTVTEH